MRSQSTVKEKISIDQNIEVILDYAVNKQDLSICVTEIADWIRHSRFKRSCRWLACINPHSYVQSQNDPFFERALHGADWLIPDGIGVVLASRFLGGQIRKRVTGSDIFLGLQTILNREGGKKVFFLGSTEETLAAICARNDKDFPNIQIAGTYSPPFKTEFSAEDDQAILNAIRIAAPDVLWVGMTAPKQEKWLHQYRDQLNVQFAAAIGAVFDFYSGKVKRSHPVFQCLGLEWLPRLLQEPRRLWRRTGVSAPIFLLHVARAKVKQLR